MKYQWILFDADGTLFDYDMAESVALREGFDQLGREFRPVYNEIYRNINSRMWKLFEQGKVTQGQLRLQRFEELLEEIEVELDAKIFSELYLTLLSRQTMLIQNAEEVIARLSDHVKMVLITNGLKQVQRPRFSDSSVWPYMHDMIISEEVGSAKPDCQIFDIAFEKMGQPKKEHTLIVGDSLSSDIQGGNNYNIDVCWFNPQQLPGNEDLKIDYEIQQLDELCDIVLNN